MKQAIFAWREGDPRLFREIFDYYNAGAAGTIVEQHLNRSWRSGPAVIEMVNRVFGAGEALWRLFPADAAERWSREWLAHESAKHGGNPAGDAGAGARSERRGARAEKRHGGGARRFFAARRKSAGRGRERSARGRR
jgi:hypothetical protein